MITRQYRGYQSKAKDLTQVEPLIRAPNLVTEQNQSNCSPMMTGSSHMEQSINGAKFQHALQWLKQGKHIKI